MVDDIDEQYRLAMYSSSLSKEFNSYSLINFKKYNDADDAFVEIFKIWQKIDIPEKKKLIDEVKFRFSKNFDMQFNNSGFFNPDIYSQDRFVSQRVDSAPKQQQSERFLNSSQNSLAGIL